MSLEAISYALRKRADSDKHPVFWGYFPAFDWVALVGLFGALEELPFHFPQLCLDIKQWAIELGDPELPARRKAAITRSPQCWEPIRDTHRGPRSWNRTQRPNP
jgi:hypothetical protein